MSVMDAFAPMQIRIVSGEEECNIGKSYTKLNRQNALH